MISVMSKQKKPATPKAKPAVVYLRLDEDTDRALSAFISRQPAPPERTVVTLTALHEFLTKHGCWPLQPGDK